MQPRTTNRLTSHRVRRREFLFAAASSVFAVSSGAFAQQRGKVWRIGYLFSFVRSQGEHLWEACRQGLRELGYVEGRDIVLEPRWTEGHHERLPALVADLARLKMDVIVTAATPATLAARAGAGTTPIVMVAVGDPVRVGLVASLAQPGGNVTGLTLLTPDMSGLRLQFLVEVLGRPARVAMLVNPDNPMHAVFHDETQSAAAKLGLQLQSLRAATPQEIERSLRFAEGRQPDALIVFDDPALWSHRKQIVARASSMRLPVAAGYSEFVDEGGLLSYGPHRPDLYRRTAYYVDRIVKGARPGDLPVERPTRFELAINLRTARAFALKVPPSLLLRADKVIE